MIFAQEVEDFLRLSGLGEGGVATQVAEHDNDLAAMAFEDFLVAPRDDQFGQLRREETFQPPDPAQFLDLLGYVGFKAPVEFRHFFGALPQFAQQARILHRDHRLRCEVFKQCDLFFRERLHPLAAQVDGANHRPLAYQRHPELSADFG